MISSIKYVVQQVLCQENIILQPSPMLLLLPLHAALIYLCFDVSKFYAWVCCAQGVSAGESSGAPSAVTSHLGPSRILHISLFLLCACSRTGTRLIMYVHQYLRISRENFLYIFRTVYGLGIGPLNETLCCELRAAKPWLNLWEGELKFVEGTTRIVPPFLLVPA